MVTSLQDNLRRLLVLSAAQGGASGGLAGADPAIRGFCDSSNFDSIRCEAVSAYGLPGQWHHRALGVVTHGDHVLSNPFERHFFSFGTDPAQCNLRVGSLSYSQLLVLYGSLCDILSVFHMVQVAVRSPLQARISERDRPCSSKTVSPSSDDSASNSPNSKPSGRGLQP